MTPGERDASCPYVGLQPFEEADRDYFFGRERDQRIIIANLLSAPLTVLYGSSGVGKSSVLMAGVVPQLRRERPQTPVVVFRSWVGTDFQAALTRACIEEVWRRSDVTQPRPAETLPLDEVLRACAEAAHETVLLLLDQFEEFFLYHPKSTDPESFEAQFARAVNRDDVDIGVLVALREDALSRLDRFQERIPNLLSNRLRLAHLDEAGATSAIRRPLEVWNARHEEQPPVHADDDLVAQLINEVRIGRVAVGRGGSGAPRGEGTSIEAPFLQLVLTRLWAEEMAAGSRRLRLATLQKLSGAREIVRTHLERVMQGLDPTSQAVCASFFDRLVTPTGSKVACSAESLARWAGALAPHVPRVLETLSRSRILRTVAVAEETPDATSYEIYHDVLAPAVLDWRHRWVEAQEREHAVHEAREQAARRALRQWVVALAVMTAVAIAGWVKASLETLRAEANRKAAESIASAPFDASRALDLALDAADTTSRWRLAATSSAEDALRQAIQASRLEWSLPVGQLVSSVAFAPDGRSLAVAGKQGLAGVWDIASGRPRQESARTFPHDDEWVRQILFLPDNRPLTAAGKAARVWTATGEARPQVELLQASPVFSALAASPDGTRVATATSGRPTGPRVLTVWKLTPGGEEPLATIDMAGAWVMGLAFSPDGCCLATAMVERGSATRSFTEVWSVETGARILSVPNPQPSDAVAFTPDGRALVTAGRDNRVRVWRPAIADLDRLLAERRAWTAEAAAAAEQEVRWDEQVLAGHVKEVYDLAVSRDGSRIASGSGDGKAMVWDAATGQLVLALGGHVGRVDAVAFSPDGQRLATGGYDETVKLWNVSGHADAVWTVAFSPTNGALMATGGGDQTARIWDLSGGAPRQVHRLAGHTNTVFRLAFDPAGRRLVTAGLDAKAMLWDVASGASLGPVGTHRDKVLEVAWSPDGSRVATASADGTAQVTSMDGAPPVTVHHGRQVAALAFRPGAPELVTSGWGGALKRWSLDGAPRGEIVHPDGALVLGVAFDRNGAEIIALTSSELVVWPVAAFERPGAAPRERVPLGGTRNCNSMTSSPDGTQLAVSCGDGSVRLYDMPAVTPAKTITTHRDEVMQAAFSSDGRRLATASLDKSVHVAPLRFDELYAEARRLRAATTDEERAVARQPAGAGGQGEVTTAPKTAPGS